MKIDLYTKVIMSVIAIALVKIAFTDMSLVNPVFAGADDKVHRIAICDDQGRRCADIDTGFAGINKGLFIKQYKFP
jgi:hypothetical protein